MKKLAHALLAASFPVDPISFAKGTRRIVTVTKAERPMQLPLPLLSAILTLVMQTQSAPALAAKDELLLHHVNVIPMTKGSDVLRDQTVVVKAGRIASIARTNAKLQRQQGRHIDASGKWLIPGLTDAHTHIENVPLLRLYLQKPGISDDAVRTQDVFLPYVANGVLQVFDLSAMPETMRQREEIADGKVLGPHIVAAAMVDGKPPLLPEGITHLATTPEDGRAIVRQAAKSGHQLIKTYSKLSLPVFSTVIDEANKQGLRVVGHIPGRETGETDKYFQPGFGMVAHAEEYAQQTAKPDAAAITWYVELAKRNGTGLISTLTLNERLLETVKDPAMLKQREELDVLNPHLNTVTVHQNPYVAHASPAYIEKLDAIVRFNRQLISAFRQAGIPILSGTDSPVPGVVPGYAMHDELAALVRAGLTPREALESATRVPNDWLGTAHLRGRVAEGLHADLILLDANPLDDIANTRRISAIILGGRYLVRADIAAMLQEMRVRFRSKKSSE